ncbi:hydrogenase maturation protease [Eggerthella sp. YY7918]|uniref:hydrogenase maturation protease n=1 Tax=Eggerthella sp. (strain YY7918) TaxID=502558 RepID=UPI00021715E2|nr:hydrogenase maturation protease [Eggerthella sp. YY7918]BAK44401.1 Ni,Fe-hydrogenase maturation factor [Eggerthella sp. YY7918]
MSADSTQSSVEAPEPTGSSNEHPRSIAVICVGNKLMLDDGIGPAVYEELQARYDIPEQVTLFDVGCLSMDMLPTVHDFDMILTVDAVDGTGAEPGTVFRFAPDAMARRTGATASLHDLKLVDLFDAALLLGYEAEGLCLGMQVENPSPEVATIGLTPKVHAALPLLVETVAGELARVGSPLSPRQGSQTLDS